MAEAARLLSGILFIDAWEGTPPTRPPLYRLFLNPGAKNKLLPEAIAAFTAPYGTRIVVAELQCGHDAAGDERISDCDASYIFGGQRCR